MGRAGFCRKLVIQKFTTHDEDKAYSIKMFDIFLEVSNYQKTTNFQKQNLIINQDSPAPAMSICSLASNIGV